MPDKPQDSLLIVDDNEPNRALLAVLLERAGYKAAIAKNGIEALEILRSNDIDLVLLDIMMPGMNGYEVLETMKNDPDLHHIPVVVTSAIGDMDSVVKCIELGAEDYLYKPINRVLLEARVGACLEKKHLMDKEIKQLEELNQMKDHFVRTVSHEMKNPLALIMGYVELLLEDEMVPEGEAREFIISIQRHTQQMGNLIRDLLDLSRIETGMSLDLEATKLAPLIETSIDNFKFLAEKKSITIDYTPPETEVVLTIDPSRVQQVLDNLLSNAIKYTPAKGTVGLSVEVAPERATIRVKDTGLGIPQEVLPRIFDRFYRVQRDDDDATEGTGLGLAIVKAVVDQHGGDIQVETVVGQGSTFNVTLPYRSPPSDENVSSTALPDKANSTR
ncbi:MAG: response regulator [Chloroflexi bacterium]|nr:response regulator [Chloroflexota bacterium]